MEEHNKSVISMDNQTVTSTVTWKSTISVTSMDNPWSGWGGIMGRI